MGNRVVKFRGKRVDNGEWAFGFYVYMGVNRQGKSHLEFAHMILDSSSKDAEGLVQYEVIPETVGQFTGLHDKNGVEIYEGDEVWGRAGEHRSGVWEYEKLFLVEYGWSQSMWEMSMCDEIEISRKFSQSWNLPAGTEHNM